MKLECQELRFLKKLELTELQCLNISKFLQLKDYYDKKNIGNLTLWFLQPGQESYNFPDDYFILRSQYLDYLLKGTEDQVYSLIRNCLQSGAKVNRLIHEMILPAIDSIKNLYDDGKIGTSELNLRKTTISKSLQIFNQLPITSNLQKNIIVIASDAQSILFSEAASAIYYSEGWRVSNLGDMSPAINVLFDLDFQKLIGKIWKQKSGILIVAVFSQTNEGLNFFADSINPIKEKFGKYMKLALCGNISKKVKIKSDFMSKNFEDIFQWSQTTFENMKK